MLRRHALCRKVRADELTARRIEPERPHGQPPLGAARLHAQLAQRYAGAVREREDQRVAARVAVVRFRCERDGMNQLSIIHLGAGKAAAALPPSIPMPPGMIAGPQQPQAPGPQ